MFTIAACVHLTGITFYGIFASGDLQPWAEPTLEEQKAWDPVAAGTVKETSFVSLSLRRFFTVEFTKIFNRFAERPECDEHADKPHKASLIRRHRTRSWQPIQPSCIGKLVDSKSWQSLRLPKHHSRRACSTLCN